MKLYELVGVSQINYTDKKDGSAKSLTRLHFVVEDPNDKQLVGKSVLSEVAPDFVLQNSGYYPAVGDIVQLFYEPDFKGQARLSLIQPWTVK